VAFFEPIHTPPPTFDRERTPLPWEEGLGQTVFKDVVLAKGTDGLLMLRSLIAFPKVMTLSVVALFRDPLVQGPGTRGHNSPTFGHSISDESLETVRGTRLLVHPLCECELLSVEPGLDELDWGEPAVRAVRPVDVVVDPPVLEENLGLEQGVEALAVQELVA